MPFREPIPNSNDNYGPERDYMNSEEQVPIARTRQNQRVVTPRGESCFESMSCFGEVFSKIKSWVMTLGKGYLYTLVGMLVFAMIPTSMVS